jgi:hypothetical protein
LRTFSDSGSSGVGPKNDFDGVKGIGLPSCNDVRQDVKVVQFNLPGRVIVQFHDIADLSVPGTLEHAILYGKQKVVSVDWLAMLFVA